MNSTPGELYILAIVISTVLSLLGFGNLILNWKENKFFGILCLFFALIGWQIIVYLSYYDIIFDHITYNMSSFMPIIEGIAITSIEYLFIGGVVAGFVLFIINRKYCIDELHNIINIIKSKYINKKEIAIEEIIPEVEPVQKPKTKKVIKKRIVKKPIKKDE